VYSLDVSLREPSFLTETTAIHLLRPDGTWQQDVLVVDVPAETTSVVYGVRMLGLDELLVSDFRVEVVDTTVPLSEGLKRHGAFSSQAAPEARALDFSDLEAWTKDHSLEVAADGPGGVRIQSHDGGSVFLNQLYQRIDAAPWRGRRLRVAALLRATDAERGAGLCLSVDGARHLGIAFDGPPYSGVEGTTAWVERACVVDVPEEAHAIRAPGFGPTAGPTGVWAWDRGSARTTPAASACGSPGRWPRTT
jgi:hypothetical protein